MLVLILGVIIGIITRAGIDVNTAIFTGSCLGIGTCVCIGFGIGNYNCIMKVMIM